MKTLTLSGYNIHLGVDDGKLIIKDGRDLDKEPIQYTYKPKFIDIDQVVLYGHTGNLSLSAIKWLMKHKIPIQVIDYDGSLLTTMDPPRSKVGGVRLAQYQAYHDNRLNIAKKFIEAKLIRSDGVISWLTERYPEISDECSTEDFDRHFRDLKNVTKIKEILGVEGNYAKKYWRALRLIFPEKFGFEERGFGKNDRPLGSIDPINSLFNYGYAYLEGLCRRAIYSANLDPYIGFLHEQRVTKEPLVYDFQEPFRWLVDLTVIQALERNQFNKKDFIRTDDYIIRIRPEGVRKLIFELDRTFSQMEKYKNLHQQWGNLILAKGQELSNFLTGKRKTLDFSSPKVKMDRVDSKELRDTGFTVTAGFLTVTR